MSCNCNGEHDHHHEHHHDHEDMDIMYLTLEDGSELKCEVVVIYEVEGKEYIALLPEGGERVFLYRYVETEEGPELSIIEDEDEFNNVAKVYNDLKEEENEEE